MKSSRCAGGTDDVGMVGLPLDLIEIRRERVAPSARGEANPNRNAYRTAIALNRDPSYATSSSRHARPVSSARMWWPIAPSRFRPAGAFGFLHVAGRICLFE
jgi:hypothetical protein